MWAGRVLLTLLLGCLVPNSPALAQNSLGTATTTAFSKSDKKDVALLAAIFESRITIGRIFPKAEAKHSWPNGQMLWRAGEGGMILASADCGQSWRHITTPTFETLVAIRVLSPRETSVLHRGPKGVAIGESGTVLVSNDWGNSWIKANQTVDIPTANPIITGHGIDDMSINLDDGRKAIVTIHNKKPIIIEQNFDKYSNHNKEINYQNNSIECKNTHKYKSCKKNKCEYAPENFLNLTSIIRNSQFICGKSNSNCNLFDNKNKSNVEKFCDNLYEQGSVLDFGHHSKLCLHFDDPYIRINKHEISGTHKKVGSFSIQTGPPTSAAVTKSRIFLLINIDAPSPEDNNSRDKPQKPKTTLIEIYNRYGELQKKYEAVQTEGTKDLVASGLLSIAVGRTKTEAWVAGKNGTLGLIAENSDMAISINTGTTSALTSIDFDSKSNTGLATAEDGSLLYFRLQTHNQ